MKEADFLAVITAEPDEDLHRLVYADWLEENGQADRGEFIRAQVELARVPAGECRPLAARARELLAAHEEEWAAPLLALVRKVNFRRGLVERVTLTAPDFLANADELFAQAPIREAVLVNTGPELAELARCPALAHLRLLDFRDNAFSDDDLAILFASPHLGGLRAFVLRLQGVGDSVIQALTSAERPLALETLDLYGAGVSGAGALELADWPGAATLRTLILGGSDLTEDAEYLTTSPRLAGLRGLHLAFAHLDDRDARALAASPHLLNLQALNLRHNAITEGAIPLWQRFGDCVYH